jgi:hypothetical protein
VVAVVEVDPIPIRQLLAVQVDRVVAVPEQHQRNTHVLLKMEQVEVRTSVVVVVVPGIALPRTRKALEAPEVLE